MVCQYVHTLLRRGFSKGVEGGFPLPTIKWLNRVASQFFLYWLSTLKKWSHKLSSNFLKLLFETQIINATYEQFSTTYSSVLICSTILSCQKSDKPKIPTIKWVRTYFFIDENCLKPDENFMLKTVSFA
jgi:hypothetical protein